MFPFGGGGNGGGGFGGNEFNPDDLFGSNRPDNSRGDDNEGFYARRPAREANASTSSTAAATGAIVFGNSSGECSIKAFCKFCEEESTFRYSLADVRKKFSQSRLALPSFMSTANHLNRHGGTSLSSSAGSRASRINSEAGSPFASIPGVSSFGEIGGRDSHRDILYRPPPTSDPTAPVFVILRCVCTECLYPSDIKVPVPESVYRNSMLPGFGTGTSGGGFSPTAPLPRQVSEGGVSNPSSATESGSTLPDDTSSEEITQDNRLPSDMQERLRRQQQVRQDEEDQRRQQLQQQRQLQQQQQQQQTRSNHPGNNNEDGEESLLHNMGALGNLNGMVDPMQGPDLTELSPFLAQLLLLSLQQGLPTSPTGSSTLDGDQDSPNTSNVQDDIASISSFFNFPRPQVSEGQSSMAQMARAQEGMSMEQMMERISREQIRKPTDKKYIEKLEKLKRVLKDEDVHQVCFVVEGLSKEFHLAPAQFGLGASLFDKPTFGKKEGEAVTKMASEGAPISESTKLSPDVFHLSKSENVRMLAEGTLSLPPAADAKLRSGSSLSLTSPELTGSDLSPVEPMIAFTPPSHEAKSKTISILSRGVIPFADKCRRALHNGASAVVVLQTDPKGAWPYAMTDSSLLGSKDVTIPCAMLSLPNSKMLLEKLPNFISDEKVAPKAWMYLRERPIECAVCMSECQVEDEVIPLPCKHLFHSDCILPWLNEQHTCPLCRFELPSEKPVVANPRDENMEQMKSDMYT